MKVSFTKKKLITLITGIVLVFISYLGCYFYLIYPKLTIIDQVTHQLETEKQILLTLEKSLLKEEDHIEETTELQRQLPVEPLMDQLLLDFQRVEALSNSYIISMTIDQDSTVHSVVQEDVEENLENSFDTIEGIVVMNVSVTVNAKMYEDLFQFLVEIDRLPRIVSIDNISFIGAQETEIIHDPQEYLEFFVTVSTFYYPDLYELSDEVPKVIHPNPSEKQSPLLIQ
ncbi:hypothetical protein BKP45_12420 [Anaerobacillus alkalidiazotrophicus]|uniref:Pilus assembly protein PilO n=1 Tax=Anaerobacillus alkalidiazotrophicus TaxID=472963 RepID=A0A1S2M193_9BACI|nr:type 4a pilus biogenesis protein PilO [Anaerobacillus alkalidiazotrophicus]OIJ18374.1 hypothetical protein BKP45_18135 [Anaerobacillus alkalidiazotrophicus]OIJ19853.1 hypothetical protein BKP45_12420 [Anaerobacillus alkalidiazotrophicus]